MKTEKIRKELRRQLDILCDGHEEVMLKASELNLELVKFESYKSAIYAMKARKLFEELVAEMECQDLSVRQTAEKLKKVKEKLRVE